MWYAFFVTAGGFGLLMYAFSDFTFGRSGKPSDFPGLRCAAVLRTKSFQFLTQKKKDKIMDLFEPSIEQPGRVAYQVKEIDYKPYLYNDHFQNYKRYKVPKAQLIIADIPYNIGTDAYGSNPSWYVGGDNKNGASELAGKEFFDTDKNFRISEFLHFCSTMLLKEPKEPGKAPCMIVFCAFEQQFELIEKAKKYGLKNYINLVFRKNFSPQVLKANMRVVGNCEYAILLYRDKLPKFNNNGKMVFNCLEWVRDTTVEKIHPTQKPVRTLANLIELFTDKGDVVIDPCAGSGSSLLAAIQTGRQAYGFEIKKNFYKDAKEKVLRNIQKSMF